MFASNSLNVLLTFPEMQYVISQSLQIKENLIKFKKDTNGWESVLAF